MVEHLDSTKLVPFKKRRSAGYHLPGLAKEEETQIIDEVDPALRPEEQGFVRHYLAYADVLLKSAAFESTDVEPNGDGGHIKEMLRRGKNGKPHRAA